MTYPHPSKKYQETVCTAGVSEKGEWVRLYPVDYRYRPGHQKFKKWQWIDVALGPTGHGNDQRIESREPDLSSIRLIGEPLPTTDGWRARRRIIDNLPHHTLGELQGLYAERRVSLGIIRPTRVLDLKAVPVSREWAPKYQALWSQLRLFGTQKPLTKLPFKFRYIFECQDSPAPHHVMTEDWELGVLFLKERQRLGSEDAAVKSVRCNFLDKMSGPDRDLRFFMGTRHPYNEWLIIGTFWPPNIAQSGSLFTVSDSSPEVLL